MNVTQLTQSIKSLHDEMQTITLAAGVTASTYDAVVCVDSDLTVEDLEDRLSFLNAVRSHEYQAVLEIWRLLPAKVWQRYSDFGETQLREQKLLKAARKELRKVWRKKYGEKESVSLEGFDSSSPA